MGTIPDIVVLGAQGSGGNMVTVDHVPAQGESIVARDFHVVKDGGKGGHQSMVVGRLGGSAAFVGRIPIGPRSDDALQWLVDDGVNVDHVIREGEEPEHGGLIMIDSEGVSTIVSIPGARHDLTFGECESAIRQCAAAKVFVTGFEIPADTALEAARLAKSLGMTTLLNPSPVPAGELGSLKYIDIMVPNESEANVLMGQECIPEVPLELARALRERFGVGMVVLTLGSDGICACDHERTWEIPGCAVDVVCTTGAGDTFLGTFAWAIAGGVPMHQALHYGNCAAAISVSRAGTIDSFPTWGEVEEFIQAHEPTQQRRG